MENMIKKIVDADNEAKAMEQDALQEKERLNKEIEAEAQQIYESYMSKADEAVKRKEAIITQKAEQQLQEVKQKQQSALIKLKSDYEQNCNKWVDSIVARTIS